MKNKLTLSIDLGKVDVGALDGGRGATDVEGKIGHLGVAREDETTGLRVVGGTGNGGVVSVDGSRVGEDEGGTGVGNGLSTSGTLLGGAAVNGKAFAGELPESLGVVDGDPGHGAGELGGVDAAELVGAGGVGTKVSSEERLGERGHDVVEEGLLLLGLDGVELGKGKTEETVVVGVLDERLGDGGGELDGLGSDSGATNVDRVGTDVSGGSGAITVADLEGSTLHQSERLRLGGIENSVSRGSSSAQLVVEHPEIRRTRVKVEVESLATNIDGRQVLDVVCLGGVDDETSAGSSSGSIARVGGGGRTSTGSSSSLGSLLLLLALGNHLVGLNRLHQAGGNRHAVLSESLEQCPGTILASVIGVCHPLDLVDTTLLDGGWCSSHKSHEGHEEEDLH